MTEKLIINIKTVLTALAAGGIGFFSMVCVLSQAFKGDIILSQRIELGSISIHYYGMIIGIAVLAAYWLILKTRQGISKSEVETIFVYTVICGFLGARIYHVIVEFGRYAASPAEILAVWNGGLSIFGAMIGGMLGLWLYVRKGKNYSLWMLLDWIAPAVALGQIIGRFGNFVNYELYGSPTDVIWRMFVPEDFRMPGYESFQFFHPLFLYEIGGLIVIFVLLMRLKLGTGKVFLLWLVLYNLMRFFLEFLRVDSIFISGVRLNALVALALAAAGIYLWHRLGKNTSSINTKE